MEQPSARQRSLNLLANAKLRARSPGKPLRKPPNGAASAPNPRPNDPHPSNLSGAAALSLDA